jgi:hypothetical protein
VRDHRSNPALACDGAIGLAVVTFVANGSARIDVRPKPEEDGEVRRITLLAAGQIKGEDMAVKVGLRVDLGGEATP